MKKLILIKITLLIIILAEEIRSARKSKIHIKTSDVSISGDALTKYRNSQT